MKKQHVGFTARVERSRNGRVWVRWSDDARREYLGAVCVGWVYNVDGLWSATGLGIDGTTHTPFGGLYRTRFDAIEALERAYRFAHSATRFA